MRAFDVTLFEVDPGPEIKLTFPGWIELERINPDLGSLRTVVINILGADTKTIRAIYAVGAPHLDLNALLETMPLCRLAKSALDAVMKLLNGGVATPESVSRYLRWPN